MKQDTKIYTQAEMEAIIKKKNTNWRKWLDQEIKAERERVGKMIEGLRFVKGRNGAYGKKKSIWAKESKSYARSYNKALSDLKKDLKQALNKEV